MRIIQYGCITLSKFFEDDAPLLSADLLQSHDVIQKSRKYLRILYSVFNLKKILKYHQRDSTSFLRKVYILSKFIVMAYYATDSFQTVGNHFFFSNSKLVRRISIIRLLFLISGRLEYKGKD